MMFRPRSRVRAVWLVVLSLVLNLVIGAAPTWAAAQTRSTTVSLTGGTDVGISYPLTDVCDECVPDALAQVFTGQSGAFGFGAGVTTVVDRLDWTSPASIDVAYDDSLLRQGQTLVLDDTLTTTEGVIHATGSIAGSYGMFRRAGGGAWEPSGASTDFARDVSWTFSCAVPLPDESPRPCSSPAQTVDIGSVTLFTIADVADLDIVFKVAVGLTATVTSDGIVSVRQVRVIGGSASQNADLQWVGSSPSTVTDSQKLACTQPSGSDVHYDFTAVSAQSPTQVLASRTGLTASAVVSTLLGDEEISSLGEFGAFANPPSDISFGLAGSDAGVNLGTLAKNNVAPTAEPGGGASRTYGGEQGSPVTFNGSLSSSVCGFPSLRWDFSDGGVAFGEKPQHTFQGSGLYSGLLTATDATGLVSTTTFSVSIINLAPAAFAGPDTTGAWGRPIAFNGAGTDPGTVDQTTLTYEWSFGDDSPSATGGPSVTHVYAAPGDYPAVLTVCDRHGACDTDGRTVHIRKRDVRLGSLGDTSGTYDTAGTRHGSLTDEFGSNVNGRTVDFTVAGVSVGSGVTDSLGSARVAWTPGLDAGTYGTGASFAGDSLYTPASGNGSVTIANKATSVAYTGALTGGANKTIVLSAVLTDATGKALAGRSIQFRLGTQTVLADTNASGVASTSLKLNQKNGTYSLTATWTPAAPDAARYVGSAASATFKLQTR